MSLFLNFFSNEIAIPTSIYLQNLASIRPRTSLVTFARSPRTDPPGIAAEAKQRELEENQARLAVADYDRVDRAERIAQESASVRSALQVEVDEGKALIAKLQQEMNAMQVKRARFMTGGGYRLLASANFGELILGCIEAKFCK